MFGFLPTGAYGLRREEFKEFFSRKISGPEEQVPELIRFMFYGSKYV